ncbi:transcriptional regulator, LacI family [Lachnospiraceae bacterium KH1T2]|nr:transcriptional regulator, LacI family [Lachnospiraceae bacterium KH1T2]
MNNEITMADIGRKLGVSTVTVSKALSGKSGVSDDLKEKIIAEAARSGYQKLRKRHEKKEKNTVGVIVSERYLRDKQSFYWQMYQNIMLNAGNMRLFTLLEVISTDVEASLEMPKLITQNKADSIIILGPISTKYSTELINHTNVPFLSLDSKYENFPGDAVIADNIAGGYCMTKYLLDHGHKKIGYVGSLNVTPSIDNRYLGYIKALIGSGIKPEWKWKIDDRNIETGIIGAEGTFELPLDDMPTAFFCNCDVAAVELIERLEKNGFSVPEDIAVVGFDNFVSDRESKIGITTYEVDLMAMSEQALKILKNRFEHPTAPDHVVMMRGHMIERESVCNIDN